MAILTSQPGLKISIVDNSGTAFQELPDSDAEHSEKLVSRYIEARSGTEFGIRWEITSPWPAHTLLLRFYVDKRCVASIYCLHNKYGHGTYTGTQAGASFVVNGQEFQQKLAFAALDIDDSAPPHGVMVKDIKGIGDIQVKAHFVKNLVQIASNNNRAFLDSARLDKIPEKALKGQSLSHQTVFGAVQPVGNRSVMDCEFVDPAKEPFATYIFKYRSRDALKSLLILPRSPSAVPLEERDVDTLSPEEMRGLLKRQRESDAVARGVKQERGIKRERTEERSITYTDDGDNDEVSVVSAKKRRTSYKTSLNENGAEEIDLT